MATKDPNAVAQKWATNLANSTASITAGVESVTVAPGQAAARQKTVWAQNVAAAQDKWAANVAKVSTQEWQAAMTTKAIPRIATGAQAAQPKMATFMQKLLPFQANLKSSLPARGTPQQNIQRMLTFVQGMMNFKNS